MAEQNPTGEPGPGPPAEGDPGGVSWTDDRLVKFLLDRDQGHMEAQRQQRREFMEKLDYQHQSLLRTLTPSVFSEENEAPARTFSPAFLQTQLAKLQEKISLKRLVFYFLLVWELLFYDKHATDASPDSVVEILKALFSIVGGS